MTYKDVPGWMDFEALYDAQVSAARDDAVFVELGVWHGRSLIYMAEAIRKSGKSIRLYGVDKFEEVPWVDVARNLQACGVDARLIKSDSADAAGKFLSTADFLFIDAAHDYEAVARDIAAWRPKIRSGGIMAGHDRVREGVHRAVVEAFGSYEISEPLSWWVRV